MVDEKRKGGKKSSGKSQLRNDENGTRLLLIFHICTSFHVTLLQRAIQQQMDRQATIFPGMSSMWRKMTMLFVSGRSNALSRKQVPWLAVASRHKLGQGSKGKHVAGMAMNESMCACILEMNNHSHRYFRSAEISRCSHIVSSWAIMRNPI